MELWSGHLYVRPFFVACLQSINGLPLPQQLVDLLNEGKWKHPGDGALSTIIPFLTDPVDFLTSIQSMERESAGLVNSDLKPLGVCRSRAGLLQELPLLEGHKAVLIAVSRQAGDDVAIALDYRENEAEPRVVASYWQDNRRCLWQLVAQSFSAFMSMLESSACNSSPTP